MFYIYVLQSEKDMKFYTGSTSDLRKRFEKHNTGKCFSTRKRRPMQLIYYEACINESDARKREKYLKTSWGKRYIRNRLKTYLTGQTPLDTKKELSNGVNETAS
jgi:putative endonuclease